MVNDDERAGSVDVPIEIVVDLWKLVSSLGVSLARLGSRESLGRDNPDFTSDEYREFLIEFDVGRKLLAARYELDPILERHLGVESVDRIAETIEYWST